MNLNTFLALCISLPFTLASCASVKPDAVKPEPRPLGNEIPTFQPLVNPEESLDEALLLNESTGVLTLGEALALALLKNPELAAFSYKARASEARMVQAGLLPNPEIGTFVENIGGSPTVTGGVQTTIELGQLIELGGKRTARMRVASLGQNLAGWDYETKRIEILTSVSKAFTDVLSAQQRLILTEQIVDIAEQVAGTVSERVEAGKVSPIEETRTFATLSTIRIDLEQAKRELEASRRRLTAIWGNTDPQFEMAVGDFDSISSSIPSLEQLKELLFQNPELARWADEISFREAVIDLEKSKVIPDLTVSGGYRRFREGDENALVVRISVPLPIFNRNQGGILEARYQLSESERGQQFAEARLATLLSEAQKTLSTSYTEVLTLKNSVIPASQSAFDAINEGYRLGKFGFLSVLDAQRTLFDAKLRYLRALTDYHKAVADVEGLIGEPIDVIASNPSVK
jgi:cobalt-zinc-cadmium efflux system outer membrane protein